MIKIALCLFGSIGFKNKPIETSNDIINPNFCFDTYKNNLLNLYDADIFFHTWSSQYDKDVKSLYRPKNHIIEKQIDFESDLSKYSLEFIEYYHEVNDLKFKNISPTNYYKNFIYRTKSRWHSQIKSLELLQEYKLQNLINYDFVIQARFDLFLKKKIKLNNLNKDLMHLVNHPKQTGNKIYDIFFVSSYENAIKMTKLKDKLHSYPICPTDSLPIFFKEENIKTINSFKFKDTILYRYHLKYYDLNLLSKFFNLLISILLKSLSYIINFLKNIHNLLNNIIH
tara:strand:- start:29336 stop:30184 length:849 start_codon:yes stop_codon:yes gene_type:complete